MAKKPISVKLPKEMLADLDQECEGLGCNRTDFITDAVQEKLEGKSEAQSTKQDNKEPNEEPKDTPKAKVVINLDEPPKQEPIIKTVIKEVLQDNSKKPPVEMVRVNGQLLPFAKRYNT